MFKLSGSPDITTSILVTVWQIYWMSNDTTEKKVYLHWAEVFVSRNFRSQRSS
jgi:hypothetical protein